MVMVRRVSGFFVFALGLLLACWVAYNLLIDLQPEAQGTSPVPAMLISAAFLWVGWSWISGRQAG